MVFNYLVAKLQKKAERKNFRLKIFRRWVFD